MSRKGWHRIKFSLIGTNQTENKITRGGKGDMEQIKKFFNDESGATLGEYCMLVVLIAAVMWGAINGIAIFINR